MAETELWDGKVPTRNRFTSRTITWDTDFPSDKIVDQLFFNTTDKSFYRWNGTHWVSELFHEDTAIEHILLVL